MFDPDQLTELRRRIRSQAALDRRLLDELIAEVRPMAGEVRTIKPRAAASVALTASDGGNNQVIFNPFYLQVVRVVDSQGKELLLDVVSPTADIDALSAKHFGREAAPTTPLGRLMADLGVRTLSELSPMLSARTPGWVQVYRDLCEWATLYDLICYRDHVNDTLVVRDGRLRTRVFTGDLFARMYDLMRRAIDRVARHDRRRIWLVGLAKKTEVLEYYRLAMSLARIFGRGSPCFVPVPHNLQERVYRVEPDYYQNVGAGDSSRPNPRTNIGAMYFVRFGPHSGDPVWTVDLLACQTAEAQTIFGYLLADAVAGFPIPLYPHCLQQADAFSRVADLDMSIVEDSLVDAVREEVGPELAPIVDALRLATDVAARRYE
ncbi:hypothetical protein SMC26_20230 [Actinomadura fulvescens]|uniref:NurA domain-containing protein n=1 Tax=Actinomadura fulvescens TaxID=46160 RepID=A0ABP6BXN3_9ACTN